MAIRRAELSDLDELLRLELNFVMDRISRRNFRYLLSKANAEIWLFEKEKQILGDAVVLYRRNSDSARLYSLLVSPDHRGQGIATKLLTVCEQAALLRGCTSLRLEVRADNKEAIELYKRHAYHSIGHRENYYQDGSSALRLIKKPEVL